MEGNLFTVFATLVNFVLLLWFLKHFLFDKVNKIIDDRNSEVIDTMSSAEHQRNEAEKLRSSYEKQVANLENKGREIVKEAKNKADANSREIIQEAESKAVKILKQTEIEVERIKKKTLEDMTQEIGALAILATEKILEKQLDHQEQQDIIGKIIEEAENTKWQN